MAKQPSFEEQMSQLQQIVNELQQGNLSLEESLNEFKPVWNWQTVCKTAAKR